MNFIMKNDLLKRKITRCPLCNGGVLKNARKKHECMKEPPKSIFSFNDLYPVIGMIIRSCYHCGCDVIVPMEKINFIECNFCKNKRELEQAERREKKKKLRD